MKGGFLNLNIPDAAVHDRAAQCWGHHQHWHSSLEGDGPTTPTCIVFSEPTNFPHNYFAKNFPHGGLRSSKTLKCFPRRPSGGFPCYSFLFCVSKNFLKTSKKISSKRLVIVREKNYRFCWF